MKTASASARAASCERSHSSDLLNTSFSRPDRGDDVVHARNANETLQHAEGYGLDSLKSPSREQFGKIGLGPVEWAAVSASIAQTIYYAILIAKEWHKSREAKRAPKPDGAETPNPENEKSDKKSIADALALAA